MEHHIDDDAKRQLTDRMDIVMAINILRQDGYDQEDLVREIATGSSISTWTNTTTSSPPRAPPSAGPLEAPHSGILSCFFHGFSSCLLRSFLSPQRNPPARRMRHDHLVDKAALDAATNGLAKRASYSAVRAAISSGSPISLRKMISTAPLAPITAISAVGQA